MMNNNFLKFSSEDRLTSTGERILADRYLRKKDSSFVAMNSLVYASMSPNFSDLAIVKDIDLKQNTAELRIRDGSVLTVSLNDLQVMDEISPRQMWKRVAQDVVKNMDNPDQWEHRFYELLKGWRYIPGGRILSSSGTSLNQTAYNCFVIPSIGPNKSDFTESLFEIMEILSRSGGVGINLSGIPPRNTQHQVVENLSMALQMDIWHPDIEQFIQEDYPEAAKNVILNDDFIRSAGKGEEFKLQFPDIDSPYYSEQWDGSMTSWIDTGLPVKEYGKVDATRLLEKLKESRVNIVFTCPENVLTPEDSKEGIVQAVKKLWASELRDCSINLSGLRPKGSPIQDTNVHSSGAASWGALFDAAFRVMKSGFGPVGIGEVISQACQLINQPGSRKGALMFILNDSHPDILEFITCKENPDTILSANLSVGISDSFMQCLSTQRKWELVYKFVDGTCYQTTTSAIKLWNSIIKSAWTSAEPGVVFLERYNQYSNSNYYNEIVATNPCGEQGLPGYGVCNLGAINLSKFINHQSFMNDKGEEAAAVIQAVLDTLQRHFTADQAHLLAISVDWEGLYNTTLLAVRFQDAIIDTSYYPFSQIKDNQLMERRIGLGVMGLHDLLIQCKLKYGSAQALTFINILFGFIAEWAYGASIQLAKEKGPFPNFDAGQYMNSQYMKHLLKEKPYLREEIEEFGIRNVTLLTIAPTGTTGTMVGCATGCEPYFAWNYTRASNLGIFEERAAIVEEYLLNHSGEVALPDYFVTSYQLTPDEHIRTQAVIQKWVDSSISKTCNVPSYYSLEDTAELYSLAYELGCKGVTIYRDGSRTEQVLNVTWNEEKILCPNCGQYTVVDHGGCQTCESCGFSKCEL